jgi:hypothetical protein
VVGATRQGTVTTWLTDTSAANSGNLFAWNNSGAAADAKPWTIKGAQRSQRLRATNNATDSVPIIGLELLNDVTGSEESSPSIFFENGGAGQASENMLLDIDSVGALRLRNDGLSNVLMVGQAGEWRMIDGIAAPATSAGFAQLYVDTADGDLKVKFGDGTVKTIVTDT